MEPVTDNKLVLVTRRTRLEELVARFNTEAQARFYVEHLGGDFTDYQLEDIDYREAVRQVSGTLADLGRVQILDRKYLPNFLFGPHDTVVVLGQDGLVANTVKYLSEQLVVGVNPDPSRWDGVLLPFQVRDLSKVVPEVFRRTRPVRYVTMAHAALNDGQELFAVNDLFIGPKSHGSARYRIALDQLAEDHSSSGVIVSTGLGSTGWLKSLMAGAVAISKALGANDALPADSSFPWDADYLRFTVREPFPSRTSAATLVHGSVTKETPLVLVSAMPERGVIFSDGIESDFVNFNSGAEVRIRPSDRRGHLVV